jgi:hypothetical protein
MRRANKGLYQGANIVTGRLLERPCQGGRDGC